MNEAEINNQGSIILNQELSKENERLKTFEFWPKNAPIIPAKLARAGFYYTNIDLTARCFSCNLEHSDWQFSDSVMGKHRALSPNCEFVNNAFRSLRLEGNEDTEADEEGNATTEYCSPSTSGSINISTSCNDNPRRPSNTIVSNNQDFGMRLESERFNSFRRWPLNFLRPVEMARAGFYYLQEGDKVKCAFCHGVVYNWKPGDVPLQEHARLFPNCPYILSPDSISTDECGRHNWQDEMSVAEIRSTNDKSESLAKLGITPHESPKHPEMATTAARLKSFAKWPTSSPLKPDDLVPAGFFFLGMRDYTKCFHCDGGLCNWEAGDDPWVEHARWFPKCRYVNLLKGSAFIEGSLQKHKNMLQSLAFTGSSSGSDVEPHLATELETIMSSNEVKFYMKEGVPYNVLKQTVKNHIISQGKGFSSREELIETLNGKFSLNRFNTQVKQNDVGTSSPSKDAPIVNGYAKEERRLVNGGNVDPTVLKEENQRLKEQHLCKICLDEEVGIVFLPCGHLVSCPSCAASLKDCPMCRQTIQSTVRTFLS